VASTSVGHTVKSIISNVLEIEAERLAEGAHIMDDLGADSLEVMEIHMALEDEFEIAIPDKELDKLQTVGDTIAWIENRLA
jgi:acyl carrier protein